jgi:hypothetical protein
MMPANGVLYLEGIVVRCQAIVDEVLPRLTPTGEAQYKVEVWGMEPHDFRRVYAIKAKSDTLAAQEGMRRFTAEMESKIIRKH